MPANDYVTKEEFKTFTVYVESRFSDIDRRFDEFKQLIIDIGDHLTKKIDSAVEHLSSRLDRYISKNELEHHKFDERLLNQEDKGNMDYK